MIQPTPDAICTCSNVQSKYTRQSISLSWLSVVVTNLVLSSHHCSHQHLLQLLGHQPHEAWHGLASQAVALMAGATLPPQTTE